MTANAPRPPNALRAAAIELAREASTALIGRGIPHFDEEHDNRVRALAAFGSFVRRLSRVRRLTPLYGKAADRLALRWVYGQTPSCSVSDAWRTFWTDVTDPNWTYFAITEVYNFSADGPADFSDGLSIRRRDRSFLRDLTAWPDDKLDAVFTRNAGLAWGWSQYILIAEEVVPKRPNNLVAGNTGTESVRIERVLLAMRLAASGDLRVGRLYFGRRESFPHIGGIASSGAIPARGPGSAYNLTTDSVPRITDLYGRLKGYETSDASRLAHITLAQRRFTGTFERPWTGSADPLVDDMVALEAVVGTRDELAYTIAFRISGMIELDDSRRLAVFRTLKSFYSTRSDVLHGAQLKRRAQADVAREQELRDVVRRVLRGLLGLIGTEFDPTPDFMRDRLDEVLLVSVDRQRLVAIMTS